MTYRLTANKTKLYALAKSFWPDIPPMKHTEFTKAYRSRDCWLSFRTGKFPQEVYHKAFLMISCGKAVLCDDSCRITNDNTEVKEWKVHTLTLDTLRKFELLEEVPDDEDRCGRCKERTTCPAYNTKVIYPCPYFEEDLDYGAKK